jgi:Ca2+-binding RTX toxin-like protein
MPTVTVAGAHGQTVTLNFDSKANAALAGKLAAAITAGVDSGAIVPAVDTDGPPPVLPAGKIGEFVQTQSGPTILPHGYKAFLDTAANAVVIGSGDKDESVLSSTGNLRFFAGAGSGTVAAGGGNNDIFITPTDKGGWSINTGNGDDNIFALGSGNDTISAGGGRNHIVLGDGQDRVLASGDYSDLVDGNASRLVFLGNSGSATIFGGTGSDTFSGGTGPDYVQGGSAGKNFLAGGTGLATLIGGGDGDLLIAGGSVGQLLKAGQGNETLIGGSGSDTFDGGGKGSSTQIFGGMGNDTFVSAGGIATVTAGAASNLFVFVNSHSGGTEVINGFISGLDQVGLQDFHDRGVVRDVLRTQKVVDGNDTVTLPDHTKITFVGVRSLSESDFLVLGGKTDFKPPHS